MGNSGLVLGVKVQLETTRPGEDGAFAVDLVRSQCVPAAREVVLFDSRCQRVLKWWPASSPIHQADLPVTCQALIEHGKRIEASICIINPDYI